MDSSSPHHIGSSSASQHYVAVSQVTAPLCRTAQTSAVEPARRRSHLTVDDVADQRAHELEVRSLLRAREGGVHPLLRRGGQRVGDLPRAFEAAARTQDAVDVEDLAGQPALAPSACELRQRDPLVRGCGGQSVEERQGALALPEVAADLLAVQRRRRRSRFSRSSWIWNAAPRRNPKASKRSRSTPSAPATSAPIRIGWMKLYQHVFFSTMRR